MRHFWKLLILAIGFSVGALLIYIGHQRYVYQANIAEIAQHSALKVGQLDHAIADVAAALGEVRRQGVVDCYPQSRKALDAIVFKTSVLKDILTIAQNKALCSSTGDGHFILSYFYGEFESFNSRSGNLNFHLVQLENVPAIAIQHMSAEQEIVVGLMNAKPFVTHSDGAGLMPDAELKLLFGGSIELEKTNPFEKQRFVGKVKELRYKSENYPFAVNVTVPEASLASWNYSSSSPALMAMYSLWALLCALVAYVLLFRSTRRIELIDAIISQQIKPHYQPVFDLQSGRITGVEALARWHKPSGEIQSPYFFIEDIERGDLSDLLLRSFVEQIADSLGHILQSSDGFRVAINIVPDQLVSTDFATNLTKLIMAKGLQPKQFILEVTERRAMDKPELVNKSASKLRDAGFTIALDDAGTGFNGLMNIATLEPEIIKIDKYFVDAIVDNQQARLMADLLISTARRMNQKTIAEGIENEQQLRVLRTMGVDEGQGYLIAKPMAVDVLLPFLVEYEIELLKARAADVQVPFVAAVHAPRVKSVA